MAENTQVPPSPLALRVRRTLLCSGTGPKPDATAAPRVLGRALASHRWHAHAAGAARPSAAARPDRASTAVE